MTPRERQLRNRKIIKAILVVAFFVAIAFVGGTLDYSTYRAESAITETTTETVQTVETETETEVTVSQIKHTKERIEQIKFFDVPLSAELQLHIFSECEKHNIAPAVIIAIIERESQFDPNAIGDDGDSFGLMQIQPKWHSERMERLGVTDLLNPFDNITVGIDLVAELKNEDPELYWVLMAYNGGRSYANRAMENNWISEYALEVAERSSELQREMED